jgi:LacI family transcriptional regulator
MVKQQDIADKLNISRATVVRALDPKGNIKSETRKLVLETAAEMGYKKNILSSSLASKKQKTVYAFLVKSVNERYSSEMKRGLEKIKEEFSDYNYSIEIIETDIKEPEIQLNQLKTALKTYPDGVIITPLLKNKIKKLILKYKHTSFITLDINIDNSVFHVGPDYYKSGTMIGSLLAKFLRSNEEVLILDTNDDKISSKIYLKGVIDSLKIHEVKYHGPVFSKDLLKDLKKIAGENLSKNIKGIYSSRFLNRVVPLLHSFGYSELIAVGNGISLRTKELILNNLIPATVVEDNYNAGYLAGKIMFDLLYNGKLIQEKKYTTEPSIIIKENVHKCFNK